MTFKTQVFKFLEECQDAKIVATDIEVINSRRSITCFSLSINPATAISIPLIDQLGQPFWNEKEEYQIWDIYKSLIESPDIAICNQNLLFDLLIINETLGFIPQGELYDTMVGFNILYPNFPKGIDFISSIYTDEPYWKDDSGKVWNNESLIIKNFSQFLEYNAKDAAVALECWIGNSWSPGIEKDLKDQGFWKTYELTLEPAKALLYMMRRGIKIDQQAIKDLDDEVSNNIRMLRGRIQDIVGTDFNPSSSKQCLNYFYDRSGIAPLKNIKTGRPSTDDKALVRISRRNLGEPSEVARLIMEIRRLEKQKKSYLDMQWSEDNRVRCSWQMRGTIFGRFSSSKTIYGEGGNFQNLDPTFAGFLVADNG